MKRTSITLIIMLLTSVVPLCAQSWDDIVSNRSVYISGKGTGATNEEADKRALADLISQISMRVADSTTIIDDERNSNGSFDYQSYYRSKVKTFSEATLTNTERIIIKNEPDAIVGRYIKRSEIGRIYEGRRLKILEYLRLAVKAEGEGKVDEALKDYYWAYTLLKTMQYPNEVKDGDGHQLSTYIPARMNAVFADIKVNTGLVSGSDVDLHFTFRGQPVRSLDYTYFDGRDWTNIYSARDGRGVLELPSGYTPKVVKLKYEYAYRGQAKVLDSEVKEVLETVQSRALTSAYTEVHLTQRTTPETPATPRRATTDVRLDAPSGKAVDHVTNTVGEIVKAIRAHRPADAHHYFTREGRGIFDTLMHNGSVRVLDFNKITVTTYGDRLVARSVPMSFSYKQEARKSFVENVVFTFNKEGKVENVTFGLDEAATADILNKGSWPPEARAVLINFLENYKTAFALKRADYIESIFDQHAVIIMGRIIIRANVNDNRYGANRYVERTQLTKDQYITRLKHTFTKNEYVNIRFGSNDVKKGGQHTGETYGIQIKQDYYSTHYGDSGYLYLQVDLNDPDSPVIKVRTWQDKPDPELNRVYGMEDF